MSSRLSQLKLDFAQESPELLLQEIEVKLKALNNRSIQRDVINVYRILIDNGVFTVKELDNEVYMYQQGLSPEFGQVKTNILWLQLREYLVQNKEYILNFAKQVLVGGLTRQQLRKKLADDMSLFLSQLKEVIKKTR